MRVAISLASLRRKWSEMWKSAVAKWVLPATILVLALLTGISDASAVPPRWQVLPPTPELPKADTSGYAPINGIRIWYAVFGHGEPVILLHGGLANSNYWANQVAVLRKSYRVIVMDSRGHGRSTRDGRPFGYDVMAEDVVDLMRYLKLDKAAIVGWSDGAIIGLDLAIRHRERVSKLFAFAANSDPSGVEDVSKNPVFNSFIARASREYAQLSPTPDQFSVFLSQITTMWATQPHFTANQLATIHVPTWIVDADHDEAIKRENTEFMAKQIPNSGLLIQPQVSHFSMLQDPEQFNADLLHFLSTAVSH